jgi:hypothetical protein
MVDLPPGVPCCEGTLSVPPSELPHWQPLTPGTTAWRQAYLRRETVEGANGMLKGGFVNIERKFLRVFGLAKVAMFLAFSIAGYNRNRIRSFLAKEGAARIEPPQRRRRAKRRKGTWTQLLGRPENPGRGPPGGQE